MIATKKIEEISFNNKSLVIKVNGIIYTISLEKASGKLANATDMERGLYKVSPSGYGIHWPLIDEDLSVESLIKLAE